MGVGSKADPFSAEAGTGGAEGSCAAEADPGDDWARAVEGSASGQIIALKSSSRCGERVNLAIKPFPRWPHEHPSWIEAPSPNGPGRRGRARLSAPAVITDSSQPPPPVNRGRSHRAPRQAGARRFPSGLTFFFRLSLELFQEAAGRSFRCWKRFSSRDRVRLPADERSHWTLTPLKSRLRPVLGSVLAPFPGMVQAGPFPVQAPDRAPETCTSVNKNLALHPALPVVGGWGGFAG